MIWVLVDFSNIAYRAFYATRELEYQDLKTGIIYGFFEQLRATCMDPSVNSNCINIFCDSAKSLRRGIFPDYKNDRKKKKEEMEEDEKEALEVMKEQCRLLRRKILPEIGFPIHRQKGLESDDLIAQAASQFHGSKKEAVIISSDGDLFQCISSAVHWFEPGRNMYYNPKTFFEKKGIDPNQWGMVKCLSGCKTDNVPGVSGVGEKSAILYLNGFMPKKYARYITINSDEGKKITERNRDLVILPHHKTKKVELVEPVYDLDAFRSWCKKLGFKSSLKGSKWEDWKLFFSGDLGKISPSERRKLRRD